MSRKKSFIKTFLAGSATLILIVAFLYVYLVQDGEFLQPSANVDDVIVALVLPGEDGTVLPRTIDRYTIQDGVMRVESIDVKTQVVVPGTSYNTLRDTYSFGGAKGLAAAVSNSTPAPSFILVDLAAFKQLASSDLITLEVPEHMEVFDGEQLYTFETGTATLDAEEVVALVKGAEYISDAARKTLLAALGAELRRLMLSSPNHFALLTTDLSADEYDVWLASVGSLR